MWKAKVLIVFFYLYRLDIDGSIDLILEILRGLVFLSLVRMQVFVLSLSLILLHYNGLTIITNHFMALKALTWEPVSQLSFKSEVLYITSIYYLSVEVLSNFFFILISKQHYQVDIITVILKVRWAKLNSWIILPKFI